MSDREMVRRPGEVLRIATMSHQVPEELHRDDLTDAARARAGSAYDRALERLAPLLSDGLRTELCHLVGATGSAGTFEAAGDPTRARPDRSPGEPRVADAQLSGWLDGLLQSIEASKTADAFAEQRGRDTDLQEEATRLELQRLERSTSYL